MISIQHCVGAQGRPLSGQLVGDERTSWEWMRVGSAVSFGTVTF